MDPKYNNNRQLINKLKNEEKENDSYDDSDKRLRKEKMMKNIFKIAIITAVLVVVLLVLSMFSSKSRGYADVEKIMKKAAIKYYNDNSSDLPKVNGGIVEVSAQKLSNLKYMRDLDKYVSKATCSGKVVVENNDDSYIYIPYLDCGDKYKTTELFREITDNKNIVSSGSGLYFYGNQYVFRGDDVDNYVSINNNLWRIVKVSSDNEVMLIKDEKLNYGSSVWDDRYNANKENNSGINDFNVSRIKNSLEDIIDNLSELELFTKSDIEHIVSHSYCIGKRGVDDSSVDNSIECSVESNKLKVGLLTVSEFLMASLDSGCVSTTSISCQNYNYLANSNINWWLITASNSNSYSVYAVNVNGYIDEVRASSGRKIRPVIYLNSKTMYKSGDGTIDNPYLIK